MGRSLSGSKKLSGHGAGCEYNAASDEQGRRKSPNPLTSTKAVGLASITNGLPVRTLMQGEEEI